MKARFWLPPVLAGVLMMALWYAVIAAFDISPYVFPPPHEIAKATVDKAGLLFSALGHTAWAAVLGFALAVTCGFAIAVLLASSGLLKRAFYPWVLALQMVPVVVLIPVFVIWFGAGLPSIVAITFMISFFPIVASTTLGLVSTDHGMRELFETYHASRWQEIFHLRLPYALPHFLTGVKIAATLAPIGAITGDLLAGTSNFEAGLGYLILLFRQQFYPAAIYAIALLSAVLGFVFVASVQLIAWLALRHWHESSQPGE